MTPRQEVDRASFEERVAQLTRKYTAEALVYEQVWSPRLRVMGRALLERCDLGTASAVLDLGAGVGALLPDVAEFAPEAFVAGVDRSEGMLGRASHDYGRAVMDAARMGFGASSFDAVTMMFVLFHIPEPGDGLAEVQRILKPGGTLAVATWAEAEDWPAFEVWAEELDRFDAAPGEGLLSQHELVDTPEKMKELLEGSGFEGVRSWPRMFRSQWDLDQLETFATGMAVPKRRFDSLDPARRDEFLAAARGKLSALPSEDFVHTAEVVFTTGRAA